MHRPQTLPNLLAAAMLLAGIASLPFGYYTVLRWTVTVAALVTAFVCMKSRSAAWSTASWLYVAVAVLFNPVAPFGLARSTWLPIDLATAGLLLVGIRPALRASADMERERNRST